MRHEADFMRALFEFLKGKFSFVSKCCEFQVLRKSGVYNQVLTLALKTFRNFSTSLFLVFL